MTTSTITADHPATASRNSIVPVSIHQFAVGWVAIVAVALFGLEMALAGRYGFHRDELYFLDCARHLQGGYVDQPVLVPLLARITLWLFGVSLVGLRLWSALSVAATVIVGALIAREFGGGKTAQITAAVGVATMPSILALGHILQTSTLDILFWSAFALLVARIGRTGEQRYWVLAGFVLGLGLANKHSIGFFAAATVLGIVLSGGVRLLLNRWALAGLVIAACFTIPDLWWQALHNWPTIAMTQALNQENGGTANIISWIAGQLLMVSLAFLWMWVVGLRFLWRSDRPLWRSLAWAYGLLFVLFAVTTGGKIYYLAGAYVYLLGIGAVRLESWLVTLRRGFIPLAAAVALAGAITLPLVLPVLPASDVGVSESVNAALAEEIGWPELVHTVSRVWHALLPAQRASAVIFTGNYGEAGAINELGHGDGLPHAVSGHNNDWFLGPGDPRATTVVAIQPGPLDESSAYAYSFLHGFFRHVRVAATIRNSAGIHNQEWGGHVYICTGLRESWARLWPRLRQYS